MFRNRSSLEIICHFNEKRTGRMWCVDDILWPNADKSATATVTLLKQWRLASIQIDLGREASVLLFLSWAHWNDLITPSFSAYVMSGGKQQGEGGDKADKTKSKSRVHWGTLEGWEAFSHNWHWYEETELWKRDETAHTQSAGYTSLQWSPHITVYKRPNHKGKHRTADSTKVSLPQEATVIDSHC